MHFTLNVHFLGEFRRVSLETATGSRSLPWKVKPKHNAAITEPSLQNTRLPCDPTSIDAALCVHTEGLSRQGTCRFSDHTCWLRWIVTKPEAMAYFQQGETAAYWLLWAIQDKKGLSLIRLDENKSWQNYTCTTFADAGRTTQIFIHQQVSNMSFQDAQVSKCSCYL